MKKHFYFDKNGRQLTFREYALLIEDRQYARVAVDRVRNHEVSTVWLGIDHQWGDGPRQIFETMIFELDASGARKSSTRERQWRYATEEEATAGHAQRVLELRSES